MKIFRKQISLLMMVIMLIGIMPLRSYEVQAATATTPTLTFSDSGIEETVSGSGYSVSGTTLTVKKNGVYKLTGSCGEGAVVVSKELDSVVLILDGLSLTSTTTAPIVVKKSSSVTIHLNGTSTLTDSEDASTESTNEDFEGAAIKVKSGSKLTICGDGTLNVYGAAKNGIKGAAESSLTVNAGAVNVMQAANNGIAFDGSVTINGGTFQIAAENDGIKSVPDSDDTASVGSVTINGGTFDIDVNGDGISAETSLTVNNGTFDITTMSGYNDSSFNSSTMSCKGLKASGDRSGIENTLTINGGTFTFNTVDDAVHSDTYVYIYGGTFDIYTGDDGVHADTMLVLGKENGYERDPDINIHACYEGLESGTVNTYSGRFRIEASDDGINAAGGSSGDSGKTNQQDNFNPGGFRGGPGGGFGGGFGGGNGGQGNGSSTGDYTLNFYGGEFYVNCDGDGLDSNGDLNLYGGTFTVLSQKKGGDNSPLDCDGTLLIKGATVFGAGTNPMNETPSSSSQTYKTSTITYNANTVINVSSGGTILCSETLTKQANYILYSSPSISSSVSFAAGTLNACKSNSWAHSWDEGKAKDSTTMVYTCPIP